MSKFAYSRLGALALTGAFALGCSQSSGQPNSAGGGTNPNGGSSGLGQGANAGAGGLGTSGNAAGGNAGSGGDPGAQGELPLPIEVLGDGDPTAPTVAPVSLLVPAANVAQVTQLAVRCHRCGFYNAPAYKTLAKPVTKIKASLRVVGDASKPHDDVPWIDVTDANVKLDEMAAAHGGVNGALTVARFTVALDAAAKARLVAAPGLTSVEFRFNGTDGDSNGYRVLDVQLQGADGANLSPMKARWADISAEKEAGKASSPDAEAGKALWYGRDSLQESPIVKHTIRASCSSCHASDGRDLQYFNYSNNAITQRSRFHGLSAQQGQQIAAFIRANDYDHVPDVKQAAPWNPPYQPGPGLDKKPVQEWAAGAGIDAVLPSAVAFAKALLGKPIDDAPLAATQADFDAVMKPTGSIAVREIPIALELPDWNAWLPNVHPLDVWTPEMGQNEGLFETQGDDGHNPLKVVARVKAWLEMHKNPNGVYGDWTHLTADERGQLQSWLGDVGSKTTDFGGGSRGTRESPDPNKPFGCQIGAAKLQAQADPATMAQFDAKGYSPQAFIERVNFGLYRWMIVQQWELANGYGLEGDQTQVAGHKDDTTKQWVGEGDARGWIYSWPSLFYVAPHILHAPEGTGDQHRENYYAWENKLVSFYRTNQWYQAQMTVNPGFPGASRGAMDWPYHMGFTEAVVDALRDAKLPPKITAAHLLRFFEIRTKLSQLANTTISFNTADPADPTNLNRNTGIQSRADLINKLSPTELLPKHLDQPQDNRYVDLEAVMPGLHVMILNSSISLYLSFFEGADVSQFRRCDPSNTSLGGPEPQSGFRFCVDASRTPLPVDAQNRQYLPWSWDQWTTEQYATWGVIASNALGADSARTAKWDAWNQSIWPP